MILDIFSFYWNKHVFTIIYKTKMKYSLKICGCDKFLKQVLERLNHFLKNMFRSMNTFYKCMKCKQPCLGFELESLCSIPMMNTIIPWGPHIYIWENVCILLIDKYIHDNSVVIMFWLWNHSWFWYPLWKRHFFCKF